LCSSFFSRPEECADLLSGFGGHAAAAGLSVQQDNLRAFASRLEGLCASAGNFLAPRPFLADLEIPLSLMKRLGSELIDDLRIFEPCGEANPAPCFLARGIEVAAARRLDGGHTKAVLRGGSGIFFSGVKWQDYHPDLFSAGALLDIIYRPSPDRFARFEGVDGAIILEIVHAQPAAV